MSIVIPSSIKIFLATKIYYTQVGFIPGIDQEDRKYTKWRREALMRGPERRELFYTVSFLVVSYLAESSVQDLHKGITVGFTYRLPLKAHTPQFPQLIS
jgi:hypothetical protein